MGQFEPPTVNKREKGKGKVRVHKEDIRILDTAASIQIPIVTHAALDRDAGIFLDVVEVGQAFRHIGILLGEVLVALNYTYMAHISDGMNICMIARNA